MAQGYGEQVIEALKLDPLGETAASVRRQIFEIMIQNHSLPPQPEADREAASILSAIYAGGLKDDP